MPAYLNLTKLLTAFLALLVTSCGSAGNGETTKEPVYTGKTAQLQISRNNVEEILDGMNVVFPICGGVYGEALKAVDIPEISQVSFAPGTQSLQETASIPSIFADTNRPFILGGCGGGTHYQSATFLPDAYSDVLQLDDLCSSVDDNNALVLKGDIPFSLKYDLSITGLIPRFISSDSASLTVEQRSTGKTAANNHQMAYEGFSFTKDGPDPSMNSIRTDRLAMNQLTITAMEDNTNRSALMKNVSINRFKLPDGSTREKISGRLFVDTLGYMDLETDDPITIDSNGIHQSGKLVFRGAGNSSIELSIIPRFNPTFVVKLGNNSEPIGAFTCLKVKGK